MARLITNALDLGIGEYTEVATLLAGSAITLGQNVMLDTSQTGEDMQRYVVPDTGTPLFVGVALEAQATVGDPVRVAVAGLVTTAVGDGAVAAGQAITPHTGSVFDTYAHTDLTPIVGVALVDDAPTLVCSLNGYGKGLLGL